MIMTVFYEVILGFLGVIWLPFVLYQRMAHGKYKRNFWKRFGIGFPQIQKGEGPLIWVHAVSVGETKAVIPLVRRIHQEKPHAQFIFSSVTETGYDEAMRSVGVPCTHVYLPFDFGWILKPILRRLRPDLVVISETDFWYRFTTLVKQQGAMIALVNGKISKRSAQRLKWFPLFAQALFDPIDLFCVQTEEYAKRFASLGVPEEKIEVLGNLKFDQKIAALTDAERLSLLQKLGLTEEDQIIVVGSTHEPEEKIILEQLQKVWNAYPSVKVLLVPRHPERFDAVAALIEERQIPYSRYTQPTHNGSKIILVDEMGVLVSLYQIAALAIVGGSFKPGVGGHNILEPAWFGVPVIFGPYMDNQVEMVHLVKDKGGGFSVQPEHLNSVIEVQLKNTEERERVGSAGKRLTTQLCGTAERTAKALDKLFAENKVL